MSTIDTSSWNLDPDLNESLEGIPLTADASVAMTWQAIRCLMAGTSGDRLALEALMVPFTGATASTDGAQGFVPAPEAGDEDKVLKGDGTWGDAAIPSLGTASRAVVTDSDKKIAVSSVTSTELGYLSGVTSAVQTQIDAKAADSAVVHNSGAEEISGAKTFNNSMVWKGQINRHNDSSYIKLVGATADDKGARFILNGKDRSGYNGSFWLVANNGTTSATLDGRADGTLTWAGNAIQTASDEKLKTPLASVPDAVLDAWEDVQWGQFQFLDAVEAKGEAARQHLGLIAQRVDGVFKAHGLDACSYGILCHEAHEAGEEEPAVDLWMVRYAEALAMEAVCQRRRADRLEARIKALEEAMQ